MLWLLLLFSSPPTKYTFGVLDFLKQMPVSPSVIPEISVSSQLEVMYFYLLSEWKFGRVWSRSPRWMGSNSNFRMVKPTWWQRGRSCLPLINMLDERTKTSCKIKLDKNKNIRLDRQRNFLNFPLKIWWLNLWQHFIYIFKIPVLKSYAMFFFFIFVLPHILEE